MYLYLPGFIGLENILYSVQCTIIDETLKPGYSYGEHQVYAILTCSIDDKQACFSQYRSVGSGFV